MKKIGLSILALLLVVVTSTEAQFYTALSGGYSLPGASTQLGTEVSASGTKAVYGSYGAGLTGQLRAGYMFSSTFGAEIGLGYLHGSDVTNLKVSGIATQPTTSLTSAARAYGLSLALTYNFTDNLYGRFGFLTKVGGKTVTNGKVSMATPAGDLNVDFTRHSTGKMPFGFIGAFGYKQKLTENLALFGELEYMGISVKQNKSTLESSKITFGGQELTLAELVTTLNGAGYPEYSAQFSGMLAKEINYVDEIPTGNTDATKQLADKAPYSSVGINIGVMFSF